MMKIIKLLMNDICHVLQGNDDGIFFNLLNVFQQHKNHNDNDNN